MKKKNNLKLKEINKFNDKNRNEIYMNYILTLGFILLIFLFLISIILISRFVLSDSAPFVNHVKSTQNLLDKINTVENSTKNANDFIKYTFTQDDFYNLNVPSKRIVDFSYYNLSRNNSIISFKLNSDIIKEGDLYYIKIKNISNLPKRVNIIYTEKETNNYVNENETELKIGKFISVEKNGNSNGETIVLFDLVKEKLVKINNLSRIKGELIYLQ